MISYVFDFGKLARLLPPLWDLGPGGNVCPARTGPPELLRRGHISPSEDGDSPSLARCLVKIAIPRQKLRQARQVSGLTARICPVQWSHARRADVPARSGFLRGKLGGLGYPFLSPTVLRPVSAMRAASDTPGSPGLRGPVEAPGSRFWGFSRASERDLHRTNRFERTFAYAWTLAGHWVASALLLP